MLEWNILTKRVKNSNIGTPIAFEKKEIIISRKFFSGTLSKTNDLCTRVTGVMIEG